VSFIADAPLLYAGGEAYARLAEEPKRGREALPLGIVTILGMYALSIPLYLNQRWTKPVWKVFFARSGRDWMVNSGVLRVDLERIGTRGHLFAAVLFALYPFWLWLGYRNGLRARARADEAAWD